MKITLPQFSSIDSKTIASQLTALLDKNRQAIDQCLTDNSSFTWDNLIKPIEDLDDALSQFWAPIGHLNAVVNSPALRDAYNACIPQLSDYSTELSHHQAYYQAIQSIADSAAFDAYDEAQKKVIANTLRDFKLAGVTLPADKKKQFADLAKKLSQLTTKFEENVLDATQGWTRLVTDEKTLTGLPSHAIQAAADAAQAQGKKGWLFTLEFPSYLPVMMYADDSSLRQDMYTAFCTRASDQGPNAGQWDNTPVIQSILSCRLALAQLLGFKHFSAYSLATKMVKDPQDVLDFLQQLLTPSLPKAQEELSELKTFAADTLGINDLQAWDSTYASEKLRQARYDISQEDLKPYFPEHKVIRGLFTITKKLFNIDIHPMKDADTWHPDVQCYVIHDKHQQPISYFYMDLYARENKRGGAWMDECRVRRKLDQDTWQLPIAFITCNFNRPIGNDPALFTHEEVLTLFHEFGHALQHMLTTIDYADVSGINGIPWDAVEIASQFLENWAWEKTSLDMASEHYQTQAPLPDALFNKMIKAKNFHSASQMVRQLLFSLFDFRLHMTFDPEADNPTQALLDELRRQMELLPTPSFNRFQHGFSHIFAGGYAAGYYSYKWAEVMASDTFSLFKEKGIFDRETSQKFQDTFLASGGAREPLDLFIEFRGRTPTTDALLKTNGIISDG